MKKFLIAVSLLVFLFLGVNQAVGSSIQRVALNAYWKINSADTLVNGPQIESQQRWGKSTVSVATPSNWYQSSLPFSATKVSASAKCNASVGLGQVRVYEHASLEQTQQTWKRSMMAADTFKTTKSIRDEVHLQIHSRNVNDSMTILVFKRVSGHTVAADVSGTLDCSEPQNKSAAMEDMQQTLQTMADGVEFNIQPS